MTNEQIEAILGRPEHSDLVNTKSYAYVLVTGGHGSIGDALKKRLPNAIFTDIHNLDVTDINSINNYTRYNVDCIINLAGAKHAPEGEVNCYETININTLGVHNLIKAFPHTKIIQASTCKACNPETVYGATKLISERMVLNSGGVVARFYNVIQTSGNVFEIWNNQDEADREAYDANRYFITLDEVAGLLIKCIDLHSGRYIVSANKRSISKDIAPLFNVNKFNKRRRGDRHTEPQCSTSETIYTPYEHIHSVVSYHD